MARAIRNILENAWRAAEGLGKSGRIWVTLTKMEGTASVAIRDNGPGVELGLLGRIFEPYFSTHATGTGLGLAITQQIIQEHAGTITARNLEAGGFEVCIRLPLAKNESILRGIDEDHES
jgi:signal transduction histidine kinase